MRLLANKTEILYDIEIEVESIDTICPHIKADFNARKDMLSIGIIEVNPENPDDIGSHAQGCRRIEIVIDENGKVIIQTLDMSSKLAGWDHKIHETLFEGK